jgi:hypothetical protein
MVKAHYLVLSISCILSDDTRQRRKKKKKEKKKKEEEALGNGSSSYLSGSVCRECAGFHRGSLVCNRTHGRLMELYLMFYSRWGPVPSRHGIFGLAAGRR